MMKKPAIRFGCAAMAALLLFGSTVAAEPAGSADPSTYYEYKQTYKDAARPDEEIVVRGSDYTDTNDKALKVLRSRLLAQKQAEQDAQLAAQRKSQVGTGDRSERIRTYNYPQGRVTDHRIGLTLYKLDAILDGALDEVIDALATADRAEKLKAAGEEGAR